MEAVSKQLAEGSPEVRLRPSLSGCGAGQDDVLAVRVAGGTPPAFVER